MAKKKARRRRSVIKKYKRKAGGAVTNMLKDAFSVGYGYVRNDAERIARPLLNMIPGGSAKDEIGLAISYTLLQKVIKDRTVRAFLRQAKAYELGRAGEILRLQGLGGISGGTNGSGGLF